MRLCQMEAPIGKCVVGLLADMARTFEFLLHFAKCVTVTVSTNQITINIIKKPIRLKNTIYYWLSDSTKGYK